MTLATSALTVAKMLGRASAAGTEILDLETEIKAEIAETIRFYNRRPYALTEVRAFEIVTASGTAWYGTVDLTGGAGEQDLTDRTALQVSDLMRVHYLRETGTNSAEMRRLAYNEFEALFEGSTPNGVPTSFTVYAGQIGIWPTPDGVYTLYGSGHVKPVVPTADDDTSVWLDEAGEMILAGAAKRVCLKYLRDAERAKEFVAIEASAEAMLQAEHVARSATGRVRVHE